MLFRIILAELIRLYILGLIVMAFLSIFTPVSWTVLGATTGWASLAATPLMVGLFPSALISAYTKVKSWI